MSLPTLEELPDLLLGLAYRLATQGRDRGPDTMVAVDHGTGAPISANDLKPRCYAVTGRRLALEQLFEARDLAAAVLRRTVDYGGERETKALKFIPETDWTDEELDWVNELEHRIKLTVARHADRHGWFDPEPFEGTDYAFGRGPDGLPTHWQVTHRGLDEAFSRARSIKPSAQGHRWYRGPASIRDGIGAELWKGAPEWLKTNS